MDLRNAVLVAVRNALRLRLGVSVCLPMVMSFALQVACFTSIVPRAAQAVSQTQESSVQIASSVRESSHEQSAYAVSYPGTGGSPPIFDKSK